MDSAFDTVIVGAGSAGCVLANRLSADAGRRVLLLEAGPPDRRREIHIPPGFVKLFKTSLDWAFITEPEPHLDNRRLYWPRGKVLGGSSSINAQLYIRGHRRDYDRWQEAGNTGWGWSAVLPYFKRSQNQERGASELHSVGGPLNIADPRDPNPLSYAFVEAGKELGYAPNPDFNGPSQEGFGLYQVTQKDGRRCSAAAGFLKPVLARKNLEVMTGAQVLRIRLQAGRATGVVYRTRDGEQVAATGHVVLSAGAIGSPQLLLLSGLGPAEHLREHGIDVVADLPGVGRSLQDHPVVSVVMRSRGIKTLDSAETLGNLLRYIFRRRGPLTTTVCEAGAFVRTQPDLPQPDLQFHFIPSALIDHGFDQAADSGFNFAPTLLRPKSRGSIRLASADPLAPPSIRPGYLAEPTDLAVLVAGVKLARRLASTQAFAPYLDHEVLPGRGVAEDSQIEAFIRATAETIYHPAGTCRMGPDPSSTVELPAVVDASLKVHGIDGLRIVDASVMPELTAGNTNAPTMMIAERAADLILEDGL